MPIRSPVMFEPPVRRKSCGVALGSFNAVIAPVHCAGQSTPLHGLRAVLGWRLEHERRAADLFLRPRRAGTWEIGQRDQVRTGLPSSLAAGIDQVPGPSGRSPPSACRRPRCRAGSVVMAIRRGQSPSSAVHSGEGGRIQSPQQPEPRYPSEPGRGAVPGRRRRQWPD